MNGLVTIYLNVDPTYRFEEYRAGELLDNAGTYRFSLAGSRDATEHFVETEGMTRPRTTTASLRLAKELAERAWAVGNKMGADSDGREFPRDRRSESIGDVVRVQVPELDIDYWLAVALVGHHFCLEPRRRTDIGVPVPADLRGGLLEDDEQHIHNDPYDAGCTGCINPDPMA